MWSAKEFGGVFLDDPDEVKFSFKHYPPHESFLELVEAYQVEASEVIAGRQGAEEAIKKAEERMLEILGVKR